MIKDAPTVDAVPFKWHPYPEELPNKHNTYYIITAVSQERARVTFAKYLVTSKHFELTGTRAYWKVTAWAELPEPYKVMNVTDINVGKMDGKEKVDG